MPWEMPECIADSVVQSGVDALAKSISDAVGWMLKTTFTWWIDIDSINLDNTPVATIRDLIAPLTIAVAVAATIWCGIQMALRRQADPMIQLGSGLWKLAVFAIAGTAGVNLALRASDAYSAGVLEKATGASGSQIAEVLSTAFGLGAITSVGTVLIVGMLVLVATFIQALLMVFREGSIIVLTGLLVFAAAGSLTKATSPWLRKVTSWLVALVAYKPMAATLYAVAFLLLKDKDSKDPRAFFMGAAMLLLSLIAMPAMMRFFTWSTGAIADGGGGLLGSTLGGAAAIGAMTSSSQNSASEHSSFLQQSLSTPTGATTGSAVPAITGSSTPAGPAASGAAGTGAATAGTATAGANTVGASTGATASVAGASAATGPAAPVTAGVLIAGQTLAQGAKSVGTQVGTTMEGR
jgi:hypothetical protein